MPSSVMPTFSSGGARPPSYVISALGPRRSHGEQTVLDGVGLRAPSGAVFARPGGAGKTTTVRILSTLVADGSRVRVASHGLTTDGQAVRAAVGVTGRFSAVDGLIGGEENLLLLADPHRLPRLGIAMAWAARASSLSTSRPPASAHARGTPSGKSSGARSRAASPSFSPPHTLRRRTSWPIVSPYSMAGRSPLRTPLRN